MYKQISILLIFLATFFASSHAQAYNVTLQGVLLDASTGSPIANQDVYVVYDTAFGFFHNVTVQTNASGAWIDVATGITIPGGSAYAWTTDCNGNHIGLGSYQYSAVNNSFSLTVTLCAPSTANCSASFGNSPVGGSTAVNFFDYSSAGSPAASVVSWAWDFGDGGTSTQQNPTHAYSMVGAYRVCLTIVTSAGCTAQYCDSLVYAGGGSGSCAAIFIAANQGCTFTFYDSSYASTGIAGYYWSFGDGSIGTGSNPSHTYSASGTYNVCLTIVANDSCQDTYCYTVTCGSQPACQASYYWYPDSSGQYSIIVVNNSTGSNLSYLWSFGDGATSTQQFPSHVYAGAGTYTVCLTVSNSLLGCTSTYCDSMVVVNRMSVPFSINVISPIASTTRPDAQAIGMQLSPNPARNEVRLDISLANQGEGQLRMLDLQGRVVKAIDLGFMAAGLHQQALDLQTLPDGIYMVELMLNGQRTVKKLVVTE
jgi:PKD repeat protein